jgi:Fur family iron response transcriptional regulator
VPRFRCNSLRTGLRLGTVKPGAVGARSDRSIDLDQGAQRCGAKRFSLYSHTNPAFQGRAGNPETGDVARLLRGAGLRPTRQRVALASLLFAGCDRHVTAEALHEEAQARKVPVSLATVYNTLHQFTGAGLLREVAVEGAKTYFDTNTSNHYHFFCEHSGRLMDIETGAIKIEGLPEAPEGMTISRVDVLVRLIDKPTR